MNSKLKPVLIATIAAVSLASPALAQTTMQNGQAHTHQERSLRSGQFNNSVPSEAGPNFREGNESPDPTAGGGDY